MTPTDSLIRYWSDGHADSPAVVLTHGVTINHRTFDAQVQPLCDAGYRVITWDLRGHGASRPSATDFSLQGAVEDLRYVLDATGVEEAVLVGQSFGGFVIQEFFRRYPERVSGLVLVGAHVIGDSLPPHQRLIQRARPWLLTLWPEKHLRRVLPSFMSRQPEVKQYVADATSVLSKDDFIDVTRAALDAMLLSDELHFGDVSVLAVYGESEFGMIRRMIQQRETNDPALQVAIIPAAGHLVNQDAPAAFNDVLLAFLQARVPVVGG